MIFTYSGEKVTMWGRNSFLCSERLHIRDATSADTLRITDFKITCLLIEIKHVLTCDFSLIIKIIPRKDRAT